MVYTFTLTMVINSAIKSSLPISSSHPTLPHLNFPKCPFHHHGAISNSIRRRHHRRRLLSKYPVTTNTKPLSPPSSDQNVNYTINLESLPNKTSLFLKELIHSSNEAYKDLQTLITIRPNHRVVISCRRSTVGFIGSVIFWGFFMALALRVVIKLGLAFKNRLGYGHNGNFIRRRDRSLGGREVVVGIDKNKKNEFRVSKNPLWSSQGNVGEVSWRIRRNEGGRTEEKLPKWWPGLVMSSSGMVNKEEYQRKANRLIRAMMDNRLSGKDFVEDDIIQLRRICRISGVRVSMDTANAGDSFYRASIDYVLNICGRITNQFSFVEIDGEDARQFIAGLADNIGIDNIRAVRMVSAAVAARTRSCVLQAWALEMQGRHVEAVVELSRVCLIHRMFPPEECSPEMEMVARSLEKHLKLEQRESLLNMLIGVCGEESRRSVAEALGLILT